VSGKIGVLGLQGAVREHLAALARAGVHDAKEVRTPEELSGLSGLIIPGGESTTFVKLMERWGLDQAIRERHRQGMALFGTCAGMIVLARQVEGMEQPSLGLIDIAVRRNAFGRQIDSFETDIIVPELGEKPVHGVFIRAPVVTEVGPDVDVMGKVEGHIVLARQGNCLVSSFHPELTEDLRIHKLFLEMANHG
jgi:5'-phosphate synthase pdxT subunit